MRFVTRFGKKITLYRHYISTWLHICPLWLHGSSIYKRHCLTFMWPIQRLQPVMFQTCILLERRIIALMKAAVPGHWINILTVSSTCACAWGGEGRHPAVTNIETLLSFTRWMSVMDNNICLKNCPLMSEEKAWKKDMWDMQDLQIAIKFRQHGEFMWTTKLWFVLHTSNNKPNCLSNHVHWK